MKRALAIFGVLLAASAAAIASAGAGGDIHAQRYTVELDNAFGLVEGADLKVAGVRAGKITKMRLNRRSKRALVDFEVTKVGFGSLRRDVFCESRPQSLIGEYFIDCLPGTSTDELPEGSVIPVEQTASTVPVDLINNIMRRPQRERLRIILNELGVGVASRADEINEAVRRGSPALRETSRVLRILGRQNRILADLVRDGDEVIGDLTGNRRDVVRWVRETRETAAASAERRDDIAAGLNKLPEFLRQLRPTMAELGRVADAQSPTLVDLEASAGQLEELFDNLGPFAKASQANFSSLGEAARKGRPAVRTARPIVAELNRFSRKTPELANNLTFILDHLNDRSHAVEKDPRSPGGQGYTGFEALLSYFFDQMLAINIFDAHGHMLKANISETECSEYQNADSLKAHLAEEPDFYKRCASILGPNQQGITVPDPTKPAQVKRVKQDKPRQTRMREDTAPAQKPTLDVKPEAKPPIDLEETLEDLLEGKLPELPGLDVPKVPGTDLGGLGLLGGNRSAADGGAARNALLDFLFGA